MTRALTVRQPWASLIARGVKRHELRTWAPPLGLIQDAEPLLIHAAARPVRDDDLPAAMRRDFEGRLGPLADLPRGAIVAAALVVDVCRVTRAPASSPRRRNRVCTVRSLVHPEAGEVPYPTDPWGVWEPGAVVWELAEVDPLRPIPCRGRQGVWRPDDTTVAAVAAYLGAWNWVDGGP